MGRLITMNLTVVQMVSINGFSLTTVIVGDFQRVDISVNIGHPFISIVLHLHHTRPSGSVGLYGDLLGFIIVTSCSCNKSKLWFP